MTRIKLCGMKRACDIAYANELMPEYVGFVFVRGSRRYVTPGEAMKLRQALDPGILPVGVFVDEDVEVIAEMVRRHVIEAVQLHGGEDEAYIRALRQQISCTIIQAFRVQDAPDIAAANGSSADYVLLDSGGGSGKTFDWSLLGEMQRPYFLAGGLTPENVGEAVSMLQPFAVDASSSLETDGYKEKEKMAAFVKAVREVAL